MTEKEQKFLDDIHATLSRRKRLEFRIAHTLHDEKGWTVLDVNVFAPTYDKVKQRTLAKLSRLGKHDILPAAPKELWGKFMLAPFVRRETVASEFGRRGLIGFYVREAL